MNKTLTNASYFIEISITSSQERRYKIATQVKSIERFNRKVL